MLRSASFIHYALLGLLLVGCSADSRVPPTITADRSVCAGCKMLVSDTRYAAAFSDADQEPLIFDDIGCMMKLLTRRTKMPEHLWVRNYANDTWLCVDSASFVSGGTIKTPMNYGWIATGRSLEAANALALHEHANAPIDWKSTLDVFKHGNL